MLWEGAPSFPGGAGRDPGHELRAAQGPVPSTAQLGLQKVFRVYHHPRSSPAHLGQPPFAKHATEAGLAIGFVEMGLSSMAHEERSFHTYMT